LLDGCDLLLVPFHLRHVLGDASREPSFLGAAGILPS
jgi:hypothetical protein